jgi:hypothetical protein
MTIRKRLGSIVSDRHLSALIGSARSPPALASHVNFSYVTDQLPVLSKHQPHLESLALSYLGTRSVPWSLRGIDRVRRYPPLIKLAAFFLDDIHRTRATPSTPAPITPRRHRPLYLMSAPG